MAAGGRACSLTTVQCGATNPGMDKFYEDYDIEKPPPRVRVEYGEPLFEPGGPVAYPLPRYPRDVVKTALRLLWTFYELSDSRSTHPVLRRTQRSKHGLLLMSLTRL